MAAQNGSKNIPDWYTYLAASNVIIAVLAGIASFQSSSYSSFTLIEKNNSILYQNQANKEWNHYLAGEINNQADKTFQIKAEELEKRVESASNKSDIYFKKTSNLSMAGTMLEIVIALSSVAVLVRKKIFWYFALVLAGAGIYFLIIGLL